MATQKLVILTGPDTLRLASRLFDGNNTDQVPVSFTVTDGKSKWDEHVKLDSAEREDGSGKSWNFTGRNLANKSMAKIYYRTDKRTGTMTFGE